MEEYFEEKGFIIDVLNNRTFKGIVKVRGDKIEEIIEADVPEKNYILPGLIDAHVHVESSMLMPSEFARLVVAKGTVAVVSDPHEIANVLGILGVELMIRNGKQTPLKFYFGAPSCVPATDFETSGEKLTPEDIDVLLKRDDIYFLSEMMNFPGVINQDKEVIEKINIAKKYGKKIDGHITGVTGDNLKKYTDAGIETDHECTSFEEAVEKIKRGVKIQIREGSAAKNLEALRPLFELYPGQIMLCTDDSHPDDLMKGHINALVKKALSKKEKLYNVLRAACVNPVQHYGLDIGLLQQGHPADFIVIDKPESFKVLKTYIHGKKVFENDTILFPPVKEDFSGYNKFRTSFISDEEICVKTEDEKIKVIEAFDGELYTKMQVLEPKILNEYIAPDVKRDILKVVVVNRYENDAVPVTGFIKGFGLKKGAIGGSIAHDSHNIIAVGTSDKEITAAVNYLITHKGGIVAVKGEEITALPLEVAGLMTALDGKFVAEKYTRLNKKAKELGSPLKAPFMTLSFMSLLVIPELKIGDKGLFDISNFRLTNLSETSE